MKLPSASDVAAAAVQLQPVHTPTPLQRCDRLSQLTGLEVWLKREDLNEVRSYKGRGAYTLVSALSAAEKAQGVACASAGNHAQGVAYACARTEVRARIFLPRTTPRQKRQRIAALGGEWVDVVIGGNTYDDAALACAEYAQQSGATMVPPFDDPRTIAGQGTVTAEILAQMPTPPAAIVAPVGGGGLLAGALTVAAEHAPDTVLIGVEPTGAASMAAAVGAGQPVRLDHVETFVDGAAVRRAGDHTYAVVRRHEPRLTTADEGLVCVEMLDLYQSDGIIAEPAGALATAALRDGLDLPAGATVVCVLSGGNNDVSRYADILERALIYEGLRHYFLVEFTQEPGALRSFLDNVLGPEDDIVLFEYVKRSNREIGPALVGIELQRREDYEPLLERMNQSPLDVEVVAPTSPLFRFVQ